MVINYMSVSMIVRNVRITHKTEGKKSERERRSMESERESHKMKGGGRDAKYRALVSNVKCAPLNYWRICRIDAVRDAAIAVSV